MSNLILLALITPYWKPSHFRSLWPSKSNDWMCLHGCINLHIFTLHIANLFFYSTPNAIHRYPKISSFKVKQDSQFYRLRKYFWRNLATFHHLILHTGQPDVLKNQKNSFSKASLPLYEWIITPGFRENLM